MREALARILIWTLLASMAMPILAGVIVFLFQCLSWLSSGTWESASVIDVLSQFSDWPWLYEPPSWIGIWQILDSMPFFLGGILASVAIYIGGYVVLGPIVLALDNAQPNRVVVSTHIPSDLGDVICRMRAQNRFSSRPVSQQNGYIKWVERANNDEERAARIKYVATEVDSGVAYFGQRLPLQ